jgi:Ca2+-binding RTX toxin-like protein
MTINGTNADDDLEGTSGADTMNGKGGDDVIHGRNGHDVLAGDNFNGPHGDDVLYGNDGQDELYGQAGDDQLFGGKHSDYLAGRDDDDRLAGNLGADELFGGEGADTFAFEKIQDSQTGAGNFDVIGDFEQGIDLIELTGLDANSGSNGNQAFTTVFEGSPAEFDAARQIAFHSDGANTKVWLNTDGDTGAEAMFLLEGTHYLGESDFML